MLFSACFAVGFPDLQTIQSYTCMFIISDVASSPWTVCITSLVPGRFHTSRGTVAKCYVTSFTFLFLIKFPLFNFGSNLHDCPIFFNRILLYMIVVIWWVVK